MQVKDLRKILEKFDFETEVRIEFYIPNKKNKAKGPYLGDDPILEVLFVEKDQLLNPDIKDYGMSKNDKYSEEILVIHPDW